jgi:hypothetical protein
MECEDWLTMVHCTLNHWIYGIYTSSRFLIN